MNKYEIVGIVGEGAFGIVYKAKNKDNGEFVAIKKIKENSEVDEVVKKTIMREVKMLRLLKHDNVVQLREAFKRKGKLYLVFEYVDKTLLEILEQRTNGLDQDTVRKYIFQLLRAIDYCHNRNVIHRDIKPENLLIGTNGILKLCDFGFARNLPQQKGNVQLTDYVATRWYRSPELLLGDNYSKEVDTWAIGCIMGELTDGEPLFPGESEIDQLYVIQKILGVLTFEQQEKFAKNPRFIGYKFPDLTKPETLEKKYVGKMSKQALSLMEGLLKLDPKERMSSKDALSHPFFDGLRNESEEQICIEMRQLALKRQESIGNTVASRQNQESSRSRSGLRNNIVVIKGSAGTNFNQQQRKFLQNADPGADLQGKSKSQGRKQDPKTIGGTTNLNFQNLKNVQARDTSLSNPSGNSSMAAYITTASNFNQGNSNKYQVAASNIKNQSLYGQFDGTNPNLGTAQIHHNSSSNQFNMNSFMPSNLTSALYNQVTSNKGAEYNYDINLNSMNKSLNEYDNNTKHVQGIYYGGGGAIGKEQQQTVILEADEESYYQNDSPQRGRIPVQQNRNVDSRTGFSQSPQSHKNVLPQQQNLNNPVNAYRGITQQNVMPNNCLKESLAFQKINAKIKQKRNTNNQFQGTGGGREGSSEQWQDNQRVDTGGGEYLQAEDDIAYNSRFSPKGNSGNTYTKTKKKSIEEWNFNRQGSKKGIQGGTQFPGNKLTGFSQSNTQEQIYGGQKKEYEYNIPSLQNMGNQANNQFNMVYSKDNLMELQAKAGKKLGGHEEMSPHSSKPEIITNNNNAYRKRF